MVSRMKQQVFEVRCKVLYKDIKFFARISFSGFPPKALYCTIVKWRSLREIFLKMQVDMESVVTGKCFLLLHLMSLPEVWV